MNVSIVEKEIIFYLYLPDMIKHFAAERFSIAPTARCENKLLVRHGRFYIESTAGAIVEVNRKILNKYLYTMVIINSFCGNDKPIGTPDGLFEPFLRMEFPKDNSWECTSSYKSSEMIGSHCSMGWRSIFKIKNWDDFCKSCAFGLHAWNQTRINPKYKNILLFEYGNFFIYSAYGKDCISCGANAINHYDGAFYLTREKIKL